MDPLFPEIQDDLSGLTDEELTSLIQEHRDAAVLIDDEDEKFTAGRTAEQIMAEYDRGIDQAKKLVLEQNSRVEAAETYSAEKSKRTSAFSELFAEPEEVITDEDPGDQDTPLEVVAEEEPAPDDGDDEGSGDEEESVVEERELVLADAAPPEPVRMRRSAPMPSPERLPVQMADEGATAALLPFGPMARSNAEPFDPSSLAAAMQDAMRSVQHIPKSPHGGGYRQGGHAVPVARAEIPYSDDRTLTNDRASDAEKLAEVIVASVPGGIGRYSLAASGGLCAPPTPFYGMVNFATEAEPVWDALPKFRAVRGAVSIPESTYIADITTAISNISADDDALGGTFATKSCQDMDCADYTDTAVQILAHCREFGNLNAISWPERIRHENELTMAALSRTSETFMLDRLKALSINVTNGAETLSAYVYVVDAIVKAKFGIMGRFRMPRGARFAAYLPYWFADMLSLDTVQTIDGNRFRSQGELIAYLRDLGIDPVFYLDSPTTGTTQLPDSAQTAAAIDGLPNEVQWALHPQGAFIGLDMGTLELGIVRDSTLNHVNDFEIFGERFRNVARVAPAQSALWVTSDICPVGQFPPAGTARTCE